MENPIYYTGQAVDFFREEYAKTKLHGLTYIYPLGEVGDENFISDSDIEEREGRRRAIERLKEIGFIKSYEIQTDIVSVDGDMWDFAACTINEKMLTDPEAFEVSAPSLKGATVRFDESKPAILVNDKTCALPPSRNEYYVARAVFSRQIGEYVDWSLIYADMMGLPNTDVRIETEAHKRSVHDAVNALNSRVKEIIGCEENLLTWRNLSICRNY